MSNETSKPLRAVGYCRTSGEGQRDNTSIPTQKEAIEHFCRANGWTFISHYVDESKTGSKVEGRDGFQKMLKDASSGVFDIIVIYDISRFARDGVDILKTAKSLYDNQGILVRDTKGGFDSGPGGNTMLNYVNAGMSESERLSIVKRTMNGRITRAKEGRPWGGKLPFGRDYDKDTGKWSINERGRRLRRLLERYADGESLKALCKVFPEFTSPTLIHNYIRNSKLSGTFFRVVKARPEIGVKAERIPMPEIPEVISADLLRRVKARQQHLRTWNKEQRQTYILTGYVRCGHCGIALTGVTTDGRIYYRHWNHSKSKQCVFSGIRAEDLVNPALDFLHSFFTDEAAVDAAIAKALPSDNMRADFERDLDTAEKQLRKVLVEISNIANAISEGASASLLIDKQDELQNEKERAINRLAEAKASVDALPSRESTERQAALLKLHLRRQVQCRDWRNLSVDEVRKYLIFLFGENPRKSGLGIFVKRELGKWVIEVRGRFEKPQRMANWWPVLQAVRANAKKAQKERVAGSVDLTQDL